MGSNDTKAPATGGFSFPHCHVHSSQQAMEGIARIFAGSIVAILTAYSSFTNTGVRICPSDLIARKLWRAGLIAGMPDLKNKHAREWARDILQHDSTESARRAAGGVWVTVADPESEQDVDFAYTLLATPASPYRYDVRAVGIGFLSRRLAMGHYDYRTFQVAANLATTSGWINGYYAAQLLRMFGDSPWREEAIGLLWGILRDHSDPEARGEAQRSLAWITGHLPHYDGEICCDLHPLVIAGKESECAWR